MRRRRWGSSRCFFTLKGFLAVSFTCPSGPSSRVKQSWHWERCWEVGESFTRWAPESPVLSRYKAFVPRLAVRSRFSWQLGLVFPYLQLTQLLVPSLASAQPGAQPPYVGTLPKTLC